MCSGIIGYMIENYGKKGSTRVHSRELTDEELELLRLRDRLPEFESKKGNNRGLGIS